MNNVDGAIVANIWIIEYVIIDWLLRSQTITSVVSAFMGTFCGFWNKMGASISYDINSIWNQQQQHSLLFDQYGDV